MWAMLLLLSLIGVAAADEGREKARALYESGTAHYNLAEYKEALEDFKGAYRNFREPTFLFNIAQCERQLHDYAAAAAHYRAYRRETPEAPNRPEVDQLISEMDRQAAAQPAPEPPTAPVLTPAPAPEPVPTTSVVTASPPPKQPLTHKAWFWATVGGAVVVVGGAVALGVVFGTQHAPSPSVGHIEGN